MAATTEKTTADLNAWLERVKSAQSRKAVFAILDEFRKEEWTDEQCSKMAHLYIRVLPMLPPDSDSDTASGAVPAGQAVASTSKADEKRSDDSPLAADEDADSDSGNADDGPVWYEKM
ncbi:MAG TPA: hypothetical protein V6D17_13500 [Candidatus Obscuribacterales bacterium]